MFEVVKTFLEDVHFVETTNELEEVLQPVLGHYEIQHYICTSMYGLDCIADRKPMFGSWDSGWVSHYIRNGYYREDAVSFFCNGINGDGRPYYWSDLVAEKELTKLQCQIFAEAWDADLRDGLVIPLQMSNTELAMTSMGGPSFKKDPIVQGILHTIAIQSHRQARRIMIRDYKNRLMPNLLQAAPTPHVELITSTEKQIISLLSEDLRAPEIATITNTSVNTVRKHLASSKKKLGVDNTEALVATAIRYKLIN